ncbi:MAG: hypothetical protein Q9183_000384 [Haloplaca sp. 2 TL-2023]
MAKKSKLLSALDAHQNINHRLERQKKLQKQAARRKRSKTSLGSIKTESQILAEQGEAYMSGALSPSYKSDVGSEGEAGSEGGPGSEGGAGSEEALATVQKFKHSIGITEPEFFSKVDASRLEESDSTSESSSVGPALTDRNVDLQGQSGEGSVETAGDNAEMRHGLGDEDTENGIPLSDVGSAAGSEDGDIIPYQRLTINNTTALAKAYNAIALPTSKLPFSEHQVLVSAKPMDILDVNDDLNRELSFHQQCLDAAQQARALLKKEGVPFSRPADFFAEMVKSDEHMGKIKQKITDEAANKKAAAEARKQRDLRKFGKQVQIAKLQDRDKAKRETLEKINILKRKRKSTDTGNTEETDMFDVALEDASNTNKTTRSEGTGQGGRSVHKRQKKDARFGFGGKKRFAKSGDARSTGDLREFSTKKMKGQKKSNQRPGKSRRAQRV